MDKLRQLFVSDTPMIDVRAGIEFEKGTFPSSVNIPILNNEEREAVGICYKNDGPEAAEILGHQLVSGAEKDRRVSRWVSFANDNPEAHLYCFRGGKRSQIARQWLADKGVQVPRIEGGYKSMRSYLLKQLDTLPLKLNFMIVAGQTGSGKTEFLHRTQIASVDLEGLARHRGSAFGAKMEEQPCQASFENDLAIRMLKLDSEKTILLEDESRTIGRVHLPQVLFEQMKRAPVLLLEDQMDRRVDRIFNEYIVDPLESLPLSRLRERMLTSLRAISRRLGGAASETIRQQMLSAFDSAELESHKIWIAALLSHYYDPMYSYQIEKKSDRVVLCGSRDVLLEYLSP